MPVIVTIVSLLAGYLVGIHTVWYVQLVIIAAMVMLLNLPICTSMEIGILFPLYFGGLFICGMIMGDIVYLVVHGLSISLDWAKILLGG